MFRGGHPPPSLSHRGVWSRRSDLRGGQRVGRVGKGGILLGANVGCCLSWSAACFGMLLDLGCCLSWGAACLGMLPVLGCCWPRDAACLRILPILGCCLSQDAACPGMPSVSVCSLPALGSRCILGQSHLREHRAEGTSSINRNNAVPFPTMASCY